jgi:hypothetical protein
MGLIGIGTKSISLSLSFSPLQRSAKRRGKVLLFKRITRQLTLLTTNKESLIYRRL